MAPGGSVRPRRTSARRTARAVSTAPTPAAASGAACAASREAALRRARTQARAVEVEDEPRVLRDKCRRLARAIRNAKHLVVYTGAGISTAANIPDYRGPHGVWTRLRRGEPLPRVEVTAARPTLTHMVLAALWARGALRLVVSQNVDGLHARSGLPRRALAELHGCALLEVCRACRPPRVVARSFDTAARSARHRHGTRRLCARCGQPLSDTVVHFGERPRTAWPHNWRAALRHAARADVVLCLGSSLKVLRRYPRLWRMAAPPAARPRLYIVNLQWTPKDAVAELKINARCDTVMREVARRLRLPVPRYSARTDPLLAHATPLAPQEQHTCSVYLMPAPPSPPAPSPPPAPLSSPSASESEDERPLAHRLTAFQVNLQTGDATLLLRAVHAGGAGRGLRAASTDNPLQNHCHLNRSQDDEEIDLRRCREDIHFDISRCKEEKQFDVSRCKEEKQFDVSRCKEEKQFDVSRCKEEKQFDVSRCKEEKQFDVSRCKEEKQFDVSRCKEDKQFDVSRCKEEKQFDVSRCKEEKQFDVSRCKEDIQLDVNRCKEKKQLDLNRSKVEKQFNDERKPLSELRKFRIWKPRSNGVNGNAEREVERADSAAAEEQEAAAAAAARHLARAVLLCRGRLYPGLHTCLREPPPPSPPPAPPPPPPPPPDVQCAWCWRQHGARRCLWYVRGDPLAPRPRRPGGYLCTCCGPGGEGGEDATDGEGALGAGLAAVPGWFGKGSRKGLPRR